MMKNFRYLIRDEQGVSAIEYGILLTFTIVFVIAGGAALGGTMSAFYQDIADFFNDL